MNDLVSVIVPVYKVEKYLDRCVESIVNQTHQNLEIILVDDGSPDNCPQMCDVWAQRDDRIKVIHKKNAGLGMARNSGLEIATGNYLMFVDSDDYLSENAVEVLYARMIQDKTDMAIGKHADAYEDGTTNDSFCSWMRNDALTKEDVFARMSRERGFPVSAWGKLYKKEMFHYCRYPSLMCGEDLWIFPELVNQCNQISIVSQTVYFYYQRMDSIIHKKNKEIRKDEITANLHFVRFLAQEAFDSSAAKWLARTMNLLLDLNDWRESRKQIAEYISREERKKIFALLPSKAKVKWLCIYVPGLYTIAQRTRNGRIVENEKQDADRLCHPLG